MNNVNDRSFNAVFFVLSAFFFLYFYFLPYVVFFYSDNPTYIGESISDLKSGFLIVFSGFIFVFGFFFLDAVKFHEKTSPECPVEQVGKPNLIFYFSVFSLTAYLFFRLGDGNAEELYAVRRGEVQGSHLYFLLSVLLNTFKLLIMVVLFKIKPNLWVFFFLLLSITVDIQGSVGRTTLLLSLSLFFLYVSRVSAFRYSLIAMISFVFFIPVILILKTIIYSVSVLGFFPSVGELVDSFDLSMYMDNFAHPFVSLLKAEELVSRIDYGYMYDYIQGFLFYLRVFGLDFGDSITYYNTENIIGIKLSIIPPGHIAFGFIQLSYLGVFFSGVIYRCLGVLSKYVYERIGGGSDAVKFLLAFLAANTFYHGDFRVLVLSFFLPLGIIYCFHPLFFIKVKKF